MRGGAILAALATLPAGVSAAEPDYSIAAIDYSPGPMDKIGALKAGFVCLPKSTLRWRDVARAGDEVVIGQLSSALTVKGLSVALPPDPLFADAAPVTKYRIKVVVETVHLDQCVAGSRLVKQRPSGNGSVRIRWEIYDRASRALTDSPVFDVPLVTNGRDARYSATVLGDALVESAGRYAMRQKGGH